MKGENMVLTNFISTERFNHNIMWAISMMTVGYNVVNENNTNAIFMMSGEFVIQDKIKLSIEQFQKHAPYDGWDLWRNND